jgi:2,3-bisphosphoglycerate-independent phosphoglycerate mutase
MNTHDLIRELREPASTKIVMLVADGLGGLPLEPGGRTELETASTPNLDACARDGVVGLSVPVLPGITPGSGPGHLGLFGYDPLEYRIGRGILEALGINFPVGAKDVAIRGNFCTLDTSGLITDRRAGRIPTAQARPLVDLLATIQLNGVVFSIRPIKEHRFAVVFHGPGLGDDLSETDPLKTGLPPIEVRPLSPGSEKAAAGANQFILEARRLLAGQEAANAIMLRGFARCPVIPTYPERFGLKAAAIAVNGMYKGVARLAGMDVLKVEGESIEAEFSALEQGWPDYDFFYLHVKQTDTAGENGDFEGKVAAIETVDALIPRLTALNPDVIIVGGDHSSPAVMKAHSWHPVPLLLYGRNVRPDCIFEFGESACARGSLGVLPGWHVMPLALANAGRVSKYGA